MPIENWNRFKARLATNDQKIQRQWEQGEIIGVGKDVDPAVRERLLREQPETPAAPDKDTERTNSYDGYFG